jgi:hypothetical protein
MTEHAKIPLLADDKTSYQRAITNSGEKVFHLNVNFSSC